MSISEIYLLTTLGKVSIALHVFLVIACLVAVFTVVFWLVMKSEECDEEAKAVEPILKKSLFSAVILTISFIAVPNDDQLMIILAGHYVTSIEGVEEVPTNVVRTINKLLGDYLSEGEE
jgi:hypothetical protein